MITLADQKIFKTIQGEGALLGTPMIFVRLGGCSIGCIGCDTAYDQSKIEMTSKDIANEIKTIGGGIKWVWVTGGEPTDQDLNELISEIKNSNREKSIAIATSGRKRIDAKYDFISVSPHGHPDLQAIHSGNQINIVPILNGLNLNDWKEYSFYYQFEHCWITQLNGKIPDSDLLKWIDMFPFFRLGIQAHKVWRIP